ncbi:MAG: hypothetical protein WBA74_23275, partial [Cyclobacteriaceae bacterium]
QLYTSGKVLGTNSRFLRPDSDIRYRSNDQLFCSEDDIKKGIIGKKATLYNEDGSVLYKETSLAGDIFIEVVSYKNENELQFKFLTINRVNGKQTNEGFMIPNYIKMKRFYWSDDIAIASNSKETAVIPMTNGNTYIGYADIGTLYTQDYGTLTGYFLPHKKDIGNASVFYREIDNRTEWVLVVDGEEEMVVEAKPTDKPNVETLLENTENTLSFIQNLKVPEVEKIILKYIHFGNYKNNTGHNGYGINISTNDSIVKGAIRNVEVGLYKNGKLDGLGYRAVFTHIYDPLKTETEENNKRNVSDLQLKVFAQAGIFDNGRFIKGRTISIKNDDNELRNYWTKDKVANIDYVVRKVTRFKPYNVIDTVEYKALQPKSKVYIEKLDGIYPLVSINGDKTITVNIDDIPTKINNDDGRIYEYIYSKYEYAVSCPKTQTVTKYVYRDQKKEYPIKYYKSRKVAGTYGDIIYTDKVTGTKTVTYKVREVGGYYGVTCTKCNGTGKLQKSGSQELFKPIVF